MRTPRPTAAQKDAIRAAMLNDNRRAPLGIVSRRTLVILASRGWVEIDETGRTYRVLAEGARAVGAFTMADTYSRQDAVAGNDHAAIRLENLLARAASLGFVVRPIAGVSSCVTIMTGDLVRLLDVYDVSVMDAGGSSSTS